MTTITISFFFRIWFWSSTFKSRGNNEKVLLANNTFFSTDSYHKTLMMATVLLTQFHIQTNWKFFCCGLATIKRILFVLRFQKNSWMVVSMSVSVWGRCELIHCNFDANDRSRYLKVWHENANAHIHARHLVVRD